ncbi:hypothetical protein EW028_09020 [Lysinibacillus sp. OL1]|nr:hypothetical protein EW028_09020 [Lysinibacillus sp. OL1]
MTAVFICCLAFETAAFVFFTTFFVVRTAFLIAFFARLTNLLLDKLFFSFRALVKNLPHFFFFFLRFFFFFLLLDFRCFFFVALFFLEDFLALFPFAPPLFIAAPYKKVIL